MAELSIQEKHELTHQHCFHNMSMEDWHKGFKSYAEQDPEFGDKHKNLIEILHDAELRTDEIMKVEFEKRKAEADIVPHIWSRLAVIHGQKHQIAGGPIFVTISTDGAQKDPEALPHEWRSQGTMLTKRVEDWLKVLPVMEHQSSLAIPPLEAEPDYQRWCADKREIWEALAAQFKAVTKKNQPTIIKAAEMILDVAEVLEQN